MKKTLVIGLALASYGVTAQAQVSDSASAKATISIKRKLTIEKNKDLEFGEAFQGDAADTVTPADAAGREAIFTVKGREGAVFSIDLPDPNTVVMITGTGDTTVSQIAVEDFVSNFGGDGSTGAISGDTTLSVGATRAAIAADQLEGDYEALFNVAVAYQ